MRLISAIAAASAVAACTSETSTKGLTQFRFKHIRMLNEQLEKIKDAASAAKWNSSPYKQCVTAGGVNMKSGHYVSGFFEHKQRVKEIHVFFEPTFDKSFNAEGAAVFAGWKKCGTVSEKNDKKCGW